jgi:hypothetical protein
MTIEATAAGFGIALDTETLAVQLTKGCWSGTGRWDHGRHMSAGRTVDCDAVLAADADDNDEIYFLLDAALGEALRPFDS